MEDWEFISQKDSIREIFPYFKFHAKILIKYVETMEKLK
jgi:hypothetical protein